MPVYKITVNGKVHSVDAEPDMPLLWALRDVIGLTGTKYGCGIGLCGACMVLVNGNPQRSCQMQMSKVGTGKVTTIEGLAVNSKLHPLQMAFVQQDVPQCGYCQAGQVMRAAALLKQNPNPTEQEIIDAMDGNLCRCGTYSRIIDAVKAAAKGAK